MAYDIGINFRATSGYVTDLANHTYCLGEAYPTTRSTVTAAVSVTFGWDVDLTAFGRDRDNAIDVRLAGINKGPAADTNLFRIDLPESGACTFYIAAGDTLNADEAFWDLLDSDGTTVLLSQAEVVVPVYNWNDATSVQRTSAADWAANNVGAAVTLSGTTAYVRRKATVANPGLTSVIAHVRFVKSGGGSTAIGAASIRQQNNRRTFGIRR